MRVFKCEKNMLAVIISLIAVSFTNAQVYSMGNLGSISTCSGYFYDDGGSGNNYGSSQTTVATFCSASPGQPIYFQFTQFSTENFYDSLIIYNGNSTSAPILGAYTGTTNPGDIISSNGDNCLTFEFRSDGSIQNTGWVATIGCGTPPPAPATPCDGAAAFCTGTNYNFPAATGTVAHTGPDYDCLFTQPNPVWYFLQIQNGGDLGISMANTADVDVDFVLWGPFTTSAACNQLTGANVVDCSYSGLSTEHIDITGAIPGQYYILCVTNYSNQPTNFTLTTDGGSTATTNCAILCDITGMTAGAGACDVVTNTHSITGSITTQFPPSTGTLTITTSTGQSVVINAPFSGTTNYTVPGVTSTGAMVSVTAQFSTDTGCNYTTSYMAPASCVCSVDASNNTPTCSGTTVSLTAVPQGNVTAYQWSGPNGFTSTLQNPTIPNATALATGTYSVTITAGGCTATDTTNVLVGQGPTISPLIQNATCNAAADGSIAAANNALPPVTYQWAGTLNNYPPDSVLTGLTAGSYNVTVTGSNGCSATGTYQITQPTAVVLGNPTITQATCSAGGTISVTATGGTGTITYLWSNAETTSTISNLSAGPYSVTATDANGCTATDAYNVSAAPNAIIFGTPTIVDASCAGSADGSISTSASGGSGTLNYLWSNAQTGTSITGLIAGTYSVTASDANGCSASVAYIVGSNSALVLDPAVITVVTCQSGGSITANATGGTSPYSYVWSNTQQTGAYISNLPAGDYTLTASDANGCQAIETYVVGTDPSAVAITNPVITNVTCVGASDGSISVTFTGGTGSINGVWSSGTYSAPGNSVTGLAAGTYTVTATDQANCSAIATYTITGPAGLTTTAPVVTDAVCYQSPTGSIDVNPAGGTPPYTFVWSDGQTNKTATGLTAGNYTVTITDANGCNTSVDGEVKEPVQLLIDELVTTPIKCVGQSNGTITVSISGGTPAYSYSATQDGSNFIYGEDYVIEGLAVGEYVVIVSDSKGCTIVDTAVIGDAIPDDFVVTTDSTSCYGNDYNDGAIHINATSTINGPYWYSIDGGAQQQQSGDFYGLLAGEYKIQAISAKECTTTVEAIIYEPLQMFADINPDTLTLALGESGDVLASYQNASNVSYSWNPDYGLSCSDCPNPTITAYNNTDYVLTISMESGLATCYAKARLHVAVGEAEFMYVPNAFTPNGDGNNDLFLVYGQDIQKASVKIFNRWGELVFVSTNQFYGWDGMYKGVQAPEGLYTYVVQATRLDNTKEERNGSIMLIR